MLRCLQLAQLGKGNVAPNPMVGAVLVYKNTIIGEGYHQKYAQAHAEVNCINSVAEENKHLILRSTLYVSLEPCNHFGKTPPCTDLIVKNKIPKVVIGCKDNYEEVNGKGIKRLTDSGVEVVVEVLEHKCISLNKRFFCYNQNKRPYIILKWAQSENAKISDNGVERTLISNSITNKLVHKWRSEEASIMVGSNTALKDNPALTVRDYFGNNPVRIVVDINLKLPASLQLFDGTVKTIVFNGQKQKEDKIFSYYKISEKEKNISEILNILYTLQIQSVIVEGGAKLLQSFIDTNLWDEARIITNTVLTISDGLNAPELQYEKLTGSHYFLTDKIEYFTNNNA